MMQESKSAHDLIPELGQWNNGKGISIEGWISCIGNIRHAIGYSRLFWPNFVEHKGCIFLASHFDEAKFNDWAESTNWNLTAIESVINHLHILDLFPNDSEATKEQIIYLGGNLKKMWEAKLAFDFPSAQISVIFDYDKDDPDGLLGFEITFFQKRE